MSQRDHFRNLILRYIYIPITDSIDMRFTFRDKPDISQYNKWLNEIIKERGFTSGHLNIINYENEWKMLVTLTL